MNSTEHKVKELCARVIAATDEDFYSALAELRTFLRSHSEILQNTALASILDYHYPMKAPAARRRL